jgi:hypothetical protein
MANLFNKKDVTDDEWIIRQALTFHGLKGKIKDENIAKICNLEENK